MVRAVRPEDANEIVEIYNYYILNSIATFEELCIDAEAMKERIQSVATKFPWIVYETERKIIGYAYATEWKSRSAYKHSVESTVYLKPGEVNKGVGSILYKELINRLTKLNFHAVLGGIALPNESSIRLHEKFGFKKVAQLKEAGYKFEKWIDVGYWELLLGKNI